VYPEFMAVHNAKAGDRSARPDQPHSLWIEHPKDSFHRPDSPALTGD
jgi:hypothetical protein